MQTPGPAWLSEQTAFILMSHSRALQQHLNTGAIMAAQPSPQMTLLDVLLQQACTSDQRMPLSISNDFEGGGRLQRHATEALS